MRSLEEYDDLPVTLEPPRGSSLLGEKLPDSCIGCRP